MKRHRPKDHAEWVAARDAQLAREPYCAMCGREATVVHHLRTHGMSKRNHAADNLQSACFWCHLEAHNPRDKDFWPKGEEE